ncbi:MAG: hypothetical protein R2795_17750 [Saprospiraceae bacterium]
MKDQNEKKEKNWTDAILRENRRILESIQELLTLQKNKSLLNRKRVKGGY